MSPRRRRRRWWVYDRPLWRDRLVWIAAAIGVADAVEQLVRPDAPSMRGVSAVVSTGVGSWFWASVLLGSFREWWRARSFPANLLRLMADGGVEWPLWTRRGPVADPGRLGLSEPLLRDIRRWFAYYGDPPPEGVDAATYERAWHTEGGRLATAIQTEVGPSYRVEYVP
jgi:hypothetical protein